MADFRPNPNDGRPYWAQLFMSRNPGVDISAANREYRYLRDLGVADGSEDMIRRLEQRLGTSDGVMD
jgi:hypothetical protein